MPAACGAWPVGVATTAPGSAVAVEPGLAVTAGAAAWVGATPWTGVLVGPVVSRVAVGPGPGVGVGSVTPDPDLIVGVAVATVAAPVVGVAVAVGWLAAPTLRLRRVMTPPDVNGKLLCHAPSGIAHSALSPLT